MTLERSAIPRHALVSLLARAEQAAVDGDDAKASALLEDLHWFGHADGELHRAVHRTEMAMARRRGDLRAAVGQVLPNLFAGMVSFVESFAPTYEVVRTIPAPPEVVYRAVADVRSYAEWNPWVVKGEGEAGKPGDAIVVEARLGRRQMRVGHKILVATPGERFGWCDEGWFTVFARGRRLRWIDPTPDGARLVCQVRIAGPMGALAWQLHGRAISEGMEAEADALVERAVTMSARPAVHSPLETQGAARL